jgi:hypothetical protein
LGSGRQSWSEHENHIVLEDHDWDVMRSRITMTRTIVAPDGSRRETGFVLRIYSHSEMMAMFRRTGLEWVQTYGDRDGSEYGCDARGMIITARRPEEEAA